LGFWNSGGNFLNLGPFYPLLRRLLNEEYISSSWQESTEGLPPRKYYTITEKGNT
jgi:DNA-binding PadR family transcriptional regulator